MDDDKPKGLHSAPTAPIPDWRDAETQGLGSDHTELGFARRELLARGHTERLDSVVGEPLAVSHGSRDGDTSSDRVGFGELPKAGSRILKYELIRELGHGGMGVVFLARDTRLGRLAAIKILSLQSPDLNERFVAEARATAKCSHENIVVIYEADEHRGLPYMVLEYLEGQTLRQLMSEHGVAYGEPIPEESGYVPLPRERVVELIVPVVRALECAHEMGIVHRDLKPENVMLTQSGTVKVLDFGIAKILAREDEGGGGGGGGVGGGGGGRPVEPTENTSMTMTGAVMGTLPYMSPEQLLGEKVDHATDIWAVGIMLFEMFTGQHPLAPLSQAKIMEVAILDSPMPKVSDFRPDGGKLGAIIDRCLIKHKIDRIGSARELLDQLEPLMPGRKSGVLGDDENPFAGLAAFQESDADRFFARSKDIATMVTWLRSQPMVAITGPSGVGKSSLVRAGIIPALKRSGEGWEAFIIRPGRRPLAALADFLALSSLQSSARQFRSEEFKSDDRYTAESVAERLREEPGYLGTELRAWADAKIRRMVLFVDQFEELYTQGVGLAERAAFCACLEGVADDPSSPLRVIISIRADFLERMAEDHHFVAAVTRGLFFLAPIGRDGLREALTEPLAAARHKFESPELVDRILKDLESARGALPLLQFTAAKMWEARDRKNRVLTAKSYEDIGGIAGTLTSHADAVLTKMPSRDHAIARSIFEQLVTPERTRAITSMNEIRELPGDPDDIERIVHELASARLVTVDTVRVEGGAVELVHESLITKWPTLSKWLDENQDDAEFLARLRNAAKQWESGKYAEGFLWRGEAAEEARRWFARYRQSRAESEGDDRHQLSPLIERYLLAVIEVSERAKRRRQRIAISAFAVLAAVAVIMAYLAIRTRQEAARAHKEALRARNATRVATAREQQDDPTTALAILREVESGQVPRDWSELADRAVRRSVARAILVHPSTVYWAAYSPDGRYIVTASEDSLARVWRADGSGEPVVLRGHKGKVLAAAFSPDGKRVVTASADRDARVWNADGSGESIVLAAHAGNVLSAAFSPDGKYIVTASGDRTVRVWNGDGSGEPRALFGHLDIVNSARFSPDGTRIVSGSWDRTVRVWNADGSGEPTILNGHERAVNWVAFHPDGTRVISASLDGTVRLWSADGSGEPMVFRGHDDSVQSVHFRGDGERFVTASKDRTVRVWRTDGLGQTLLLRGHALNVYAAEFSPDGRSIVTASEDRSARVWPTTDPHRTTILRNHGGSLEWADFTLDGKQVVTVSRDGTARVESVAGTMSPVILRGHEGAVIWADVSPDGRAIVTASHDQTARVWNADGTGDPVILAGHEDDLVRVAFSPDGKRVVTASRDDTVRVWNADGSGEPLILEGHDGLITAVEFSPDGTRLVTASQDRKARLWNLQSPDTPPESYEHEAAVNWAEFSPDGRFFVIACSDATARVYSVDQSQNPVVLRGHDDIVYSASFSPDGKRVVTGSFDHTARVWNADGSGEPVVLSGHGAQVGRASFSPDGERILTISWDDTVRVWAADGVGEPLILSGHGDLIHTARFSPDGKRVVTASKDGTAQVWNDLEAITLDDPRLWQATSYCPSEELRQRLLGSKKAAARANRRRCQRRVRVP